MPVQSKRENGTEPLCALPLNRVCDSGISLKTHLTSDEDCREVSGLNVAY